METKEEQLAFIKKETGWSDEKCLEWYTQQEEAERSANEPIQDTWLVYLVYHNPYFPIPKMEKNSHGTWGDTLHCRKTFTDKGLAESYFKQLKSMSKKERVSLTRKECV